MEVTSFKYLVGVEGFMVPTPSLKLIYEWRLWGWSFQAHVPLFIEEKTLLTEVKYAKHTTQDLLLIRECVGGVDGRMTSVTSPSKGFKIETPLYFICV